jgi:molybdopterin-guanine dinucleotide biosynthesis adapter protein
VKRILDKREPIGYLAIVGYKNSGKTTLICKLIQELSVLGLRVGALKHDGHDFEMDRKETDTYQFQNAGAVSVMIQSSAKIAMIEHLSRIKPPTVHELINRFQNIDMLLIEGYKHEPLPKLVVARTRGQLQGMDQLEAVQAYCLDPSIMHEVSGKVAVPTFSLDDYKGVASYVYRWWKQCNDADAVDAVDETFE